MRMADLVKDFQLKFPNLVKEMRQSTHHYDEKNLNSFHLEGDVFCHSQMVNLMAETRNCSDVVKLACLLHDIGKPLSRTVKEEDKVHIVKLIAFHTILYKSMKNADYENELSKQFIGEHRLFSDLIELTACDALGRFMEIDEQRDLWTNAQDHFSPTFFKLQDNQQRETKGEALILVGPPMSGKSTWLSKNKKEHIVLSRDNVLMELSSAKTYSEAYKSVDQSKVDSRFDLFKKESLSTSQDLIFDLTNMSQKARRKCLNGISKDMKRVAVVFLTSYETLLKRNIDRDKKEGKFIPLFALKQLLSSFEFPLRSEGFDEIKVIIS